MEICFTYVSRRMQLLDVVVLPELAPGAPLRPARLASLDALRRPDRDSPSVPREISRRLQRRFDVLLDRAEGSAALTDCPVRAQAGAAAAAHGRGGLGVAGLRVAAVRLPAPARAPGRVLPHAAAR